MEAMKVTLHHCVCR